MSTEGVETERHGVRFWIAFAVGGAVMAFGVRGALQHAAATHPRDLFIWLVGAGLLHDLVVAPLICATGLLLAHFLAEPWRTPVRAGLILSALVVLVGWPGLRMYGRDRVPDNLSAQPLDYSTAVLTVLAVVWLSVAVWTLLRVRARRATADEGTPTR